MLFSPNLLRLLYKTPQQGLKPQAFTSPSSRGWGSETRVLAWVGAGELVRQRSWLSDGPLLVERAQVGGGQRERDLGGLC